MLTVEIEVPASMVLPNQYRDGLMWPHDRAPLTAEDFADYVRELMPAWVKDVIRSESPESDDNLDDLQTDLQRLLDEFRVPTVAFKPSRGVNALKMENHVEGQDTVERVNIDPDLLEEAEIVAEDTQANRNAVRAKPEKIRKAPAGSKPSKAMQALERVPQITILTDPDEISDKGVKGRAGKYYSESQTLFVNGLYPVVERMAAELERELTGAGEPEVVRTECLRAARRSAAFRVGKVTCYAISKRLAEDWSSDDLESATSPESLSMAADDYKQGIQAAKKWAWEMIKASKLESADAA